MRLAGFTHLVIEQGEPIAHKFDDYGSWQLTAPITYQDWRLYNLEETKPQTADHER